MKQINKASYGKVTPSGCLARLFPFLSKHGKQPEPKTEPPRGDTDADLLKALTNAARKAGCTVHELPDGSVVIDESGVGGGIAVIQTQPHAPSDEK